jgi:hypothetical protein
MNGLVAGEVSTALARRAGGEATAGCRNPELGEAFFVSATGERGARVVNGFITGLTQLPDVVGANSAASDFEVVITAPCCRCTRVRPYAAARQWTRC